MSMTLSTSAPERHCRPGLLRVAGVAGGVRTTGGKGL